MDEQTIRDFVCKAGHILSAYRDLAGSVLYSNKSTLKPRSILFYGINPGYNQAAKHKVCWKIGDSLTEFASGFPDLDSEPNKDVNPIPVAERLHIDRNLIDDQQWPRVPQNGELCYTWDIGRADYQINVRNLLKLIPPRPTVVVGNWFFLQTRRAEEIKSELEKRGHSYAQFLDDCWKVQELNFEITRPYLLITCDDVIGRAKLARKLKLEPVDERIFSGQPHWGKRTYCQHFIGHWLDGSSKKQKIHVCKMPHSSWYNIVDKEYGDGLLVSDWFANVVRTACSESGNAQL